MANACISPPREDFSFSSLRFTEACFSFPLSVSWSHLIARAMTCDVIIHVKPWYVDLVSFWELNENVSKRAEF